MSPVTVIVRRELGSYFDSLIAYLVLVAFLGFTGFFTWMNSNADIFFRNQADLSVFFGVAKWTLFFFIPAITMRQLAEEKRSGTIELLLTKAITNRQLILGKFLSCFLMIAVAILFTLPYYFTVAKLGNIDHGATISGYFGLLLMSAAYISIGLFTSSITNNQIVAFLLALFMGIFFQFLFDVMASGQTGFWADLLNTLSVSHHFDSISRGVLDSKDLVFFVSIIVLGLVLSELFISKR
jgi:gliding motility-associated transport system permease protein